MDKQELSSIAWLADYGTSRLDDAFKQRIRGLTTGCQRKGLKFCRIYWTAFERRAANWPSETEDEREMRFGNYEDRMKRMWENYG